MQTQKNGPGALGRAPQTDEARYPETTSHDVLAQPHPPLERLPSGLLLYQIASLRARQAPFERGFWNIERLVAALEDELERRAA